LRYIPQVAVRITPEAEADLLVVPMTLRPRIGAIVTRLKQWPNVSGVKPLRGNWAGHFRIRTGDWRVVFQPVGRDVVIVRIQNRSEVYDR
jgi:mRNA-degrading endonuclease RelE of RelBE toxin-antitoxin system